MKLRERDACPLNNNCNYTTALVLYVHFTSLIMTRGVETCSCFIGTKFIVVIMKGLC
jgi:hypothetical protein